MKKTKKQDPILEDLHETRRKMMEACGNDPEQFHSMLKRAQAKYADRLTPPPKPVRKSIKKSKAS